MTPFTRTNFSIKTLENNLTAVFLIVLNGLMQCQLLRSLTLLFLALLIQIDQPSKIEIEAFL